MDSLLVHHENPELDSPVVVVALEGWIDAGSAAAGAMSSLLASSGAEPIATFDSDRLLWSSVRRLLLETGDAEVQLHTDQVGSIVAVTGEVG